MRALDEGAGMMRARNSIRQRLFWEVRKRWHEPGGGPMIKGTTPAA